MARTAPPHPPRIAAKIVKNIPYGRIIYALFCRKDSKNTLYGRIVYALFCRLGYVFYFTSLLTPSLPHFHHCPGVELAVAEESLAGCGSTLSGSTVFSIVIFLPLSGARVIKRWHKWQKNTKIIIYLEVFSYLYAQFHSFFDVPLDIKKKIETHLLVLSFVLPSIVACMWNSGGTRQM